MRFFADENAGEYRTVRADDGFTSEFDVRGDEVFVSRGLLGRLKIAQRKDLFADF